MDLLEHEVRVCPKCERPLVPPVENFGSVYWSCPWHGDFTSGPRVRYVRADAYRGAVSMLEWLASLDDDEDARRAVTLQAIIDRAKATIGGQ